MFTVKRLAMPLQQHSLHPGSYKHGLEGTWLHNFKLTLKEYDHIKRKATDMNFHEGSSAYKMLVDTDPGSVINTSSSIKRKLLLFIRSITKPHMETSLGSPQPRSNKLWSGPQVTREGENPKHWGALDCLRTLKMSNNSHEVITLLQCRCCSDRQNSRVCAAGTQHWFFWTTSDAFCSFPSFPLRTTWKDVLVN